MASAMHEIPLQKPFDRVRSMTALRAAWRHVQGAAGRSISASTRGEAQRFEPHAERHLRRIADQIRAGRFVFAPSRGVVRDRPGKRARPIVVAPIESRIVERAMLDALLDLPSVREAYC